MITTLLSPRQLPGWWLRFTETYPALPTIIAVSGLAWIVFSLPLIDNPTEKYEHGPLIETLRVATSSEVLIDQVISLRTIYHSWFPSEVRNLVSSIFGNLALYLVVPFLLLLEYLFPCKPSQPLIGKGFLQDAIWFAAITPTQILFLYPVDHFMRSLFDDHLGFLTMGTATAWPAYLQVFAALLLGEFLIWFNHFARHKIRTLWLFHAVHHSQKEMNVFTDDRGHVVDLLVGSLLAFVPFFIFQVSTLYTVTIIGLYMPIHNRFIHANVKINLGWLGWLLTSPQFHRVHHSVDSAHIDKNFGVFLSIFDHLFGTAYPCRTVYPETGITDWRFPTEDKVRVSQLPGNWLTQTVYPFVQLFEQWQASRRGL